MRTFSTYDTSEPVTIKMADGTKFRGVLTSMETQSESIEVTMGGSPFGPPADTFRTYMPGRTTTTFTIEITSKPRKGKRS